MGPPSHVVAIIGGATAGAEVARRLADAGAEAVVFDMNARPFGKVEDGLPRWHHALREKEYASIAQRLAHERIHFVPRTKIGRDVDFRELAEGWGFSAVVLACGAWRDRPLPIPGADAYLGKGLIYQNPFIIAFNHADEPDFGGPRFPIEDGALVVGGGLASIDVAKLLMLETTRARMRARGVELDLEALEKHGIPSTLAEHGTSLAALGIAGCTLVYRRRAEDMPLMELPADASPERTAKVEAARRHMITKAREKFGFGFEPLSIPDGLIVEDDRLVGLRLRRARVDGKKLIATDETFERRASSVISSIGSIPEPIPGVPMHGELFPFSDLERGQLAGFPTVYSAGNVVTGKGNIIASRRHATQVADALVSTYLGLEDHGHAGEEALYAVPQAAAAADAGHIAAAVAQLPPLSPEARAQVLARVHERQAAVGYQGPLEAYLRSVAPRASGASHGR